MSVRSRPRRDLAAFFNKMRRMVGDIKSARKSMAAHHSFMTELVSVSLFPSSKASSPQSPPYHLQLDDSQEVGNGFMILQSPGLRSVPPSRNLAKPRPRSAPCNLQLDDLREVGIGSPRLQLADSREMCITSLILHSPIPYSGLLPANPTLSSLRLLASRISTSLPPSVGGSHVQASCTSPSQLSRSTLEEVKSGSNKIFMPPYHSFAAYPGKLTAQPAFWASLLSAFLCLFLCIGKEVAVGVTITAYFIIWLTLKGRSFVKQISRYIFPCHSVECYIQDKQSRHLNRRWTIPTHGNAVLLSSSESHFCTSSQSLSTIHGCAQEEVYTSEPGLCTYSTPSVGSLSNAGIHWANLKLGIMLVLALCGLAHGQILAVCMCSCCVLIFSEMQRSASKRCKQEIQNNIQRSC